MKNNLDTSLFDCKAKTIKIIGKIMPEINHHFEPIITISSFNPDKSGILFGTKNISKLKHIARLQLVKTIGIILFLFMVLR